MEIAAKATVLLIFSLFFIWFLLGAEETRSGSVSPPGV